MRLRLWTSSTWPSAGPAGFGNAIVLVKVAFGEVADFDQPLPIEHSQMHCPQLDQPFLAEGLQGAIGMDRGQTGGVGDLLLSQRKANEIPPA